MQDDEGLKIHHSNGHPMDKPVLPQEGGRLDAKRHYVMILAKALDGVWPVGHAVPQHSTAQA